MLTTIEIGYQVWSQKNLDVDTFRNGDLISQAKNPEDWQKFGELGQPAWCYYDFNEVNGAVYGKLYNWFAVSDERQIAPIGWQVASDDDWNELIEFLTYEMEDVMQSMKSTDFWIDASGDNASGFNVLPAGKIDMFGDFDFEGNFALNNCSFFWTSSEEGEGGGQMLAGDKNYARYRGLDSNQISIGKSHKSCGMSIRLITEDE